MKEFKVVYSITLDGKKSVYEETHEAFDTRDAKYIVMSQWLGVEKIEFISVTENK